MRDRVRRLATAKVKAVESLGHEREERGGKERRERGEKRMCDGSS
jgi:hypothetical protein